MSLKFINFIIGPEGDAMCSAKGRQHGVNIVKLRGVHSYNYSSRNRTPIKHKLKTCAFVFT